MGGRSGYRSNRIIEPQRQHGVWIAYVDKETGAIKWIRKKIKPKKIKK